MNPHSQQQLSQPQSINIPPPPPPPAAGMGRNVSYSGGAVDNSIGPPEPPPPHGEQPHNFPPPRRESFRGPPPGGEDPYSPRPPMHNEPPQRDIRGRDVFRDDHYGGGRGLPPPRPEFAGSSDTNSGFRPHLHPGAARGGRRGSDFRGGNMSEPPFARNSSTGGGGGGDSSVPPPFRGYGGPRSPTRGGRGFGRGVARSSSFSHRNRSNNDPRFASGGDAPSEEMPAPPLGSGGFGNNSGPSSFGRKPHIANRSISDGDTSFAGRSGNWNTSNAHPSPQTSPQHRKPTMKFSIDSQQRQPPNVASAPATMESSTTHNSKQPPSPSSTPLKPPPPAADEPPPRLLISALGEERSKVAEKVVLEVSEILGDASLTDDDGKVSTLPSKQQILSAVAKLDAKIKVTQKEIDDVKSQAQKAVRDEEEQRQKVKEQAISEAKRQTEAKLQAEEEKRSEEEKVHEAELQSFVDERRAAYDAEQNKSLSELEQKLLVAKEEEEKKLREALNEQMITTADNFDRDILKIRMELDRAKQIAKKTETRLSNVEKDYREKMENAEKEGIADKSSVCNPNDLVSKVIAENQRRAAEAHLSQRTFVSPLEAPLLDEGVSALLENAKDPTNERTIAEWSRAASQVTGLSDALYTEPSNAPYFAHNEKTHEMIAPLVTEYVRDKQNRLRQHFAGLAEEYEFRRSVHQNDLQSRVKQTRKKSTVVPVRHSIANVAGGGGKPAQPILESAGARSSSNPYRRARGRGEVRSEYEQEQILAELAAQDAMQKRIEFGGCEMPRQIGQFERELNGEFIRTFTAQKVDLMDQERELVNTNVWTDMEKAIFLDRWLQHPKDFKKIASYLRNKTTKDCVRFYYDSKQAVPYKGALREHIMRRKRRGDYHVWDATIEAALSVGAVVEAGTSEEKPLVFYLPQDDHTYYTRKFHPMKREVFDELAALDSKLAAEHDEDDEEKETRRPGRKPKRQAEPLFVLDSAQRKFLKVQEPPPEASMKKSRSRSSMPDTDDDMTDGATVMDEGEPTPPRKAPQKWTAAEKKIFHDTLEEHGRNWIMLSDAVGTKSISQIKNYYYDYKKQGRGRGDKKPSRSSGKGKKRDDESETPPPDQTTAESSVPETLEDVPHYATDAAASMPQAPPTEQAYEQLLAQYPHLARQFQHQQQPSQQQQHGIHQYPVGTGELHAGRGFQPDFERTLSRSGTSTPDPADLWAQVQQQALQQQQQQSRQLSGDTAGHLLHHHSHNQHQQLLSHLLPWMSSGQLSHGQSQSSHGNAQEWDTQQQLQLLIEQEQRRRQQSQQQQQQQQQQTRQDQLAVLGLSGLAGLSNQGRANGLGHQQPTQQHQQYHHFSQHQQQPPAGYGNIQHHYQQTHHAAQQQQQQQHQHAQQQQHEPTNNNSQQIADLAALLLLSQQRGGQHHQNGN